MFFKTPRFIRRWLRRRMSPIPSERAWTVRQKLSVAYMLIAWNCFGFVVWQMAKGNKHWPVTYGLISEEENSLMRPAHSWAKTLGISKAQVYRVGGLSISRGDDIDLEAETPKKSDKDSSEVSKSHGNGNN